MFGRRKRVAALIVVAAAAAAVTAVIMLRAGSNGRDGPPRAAPRPGAAAEIRTVCDSADADRPCRFEPARSTVRVGEVVRWVNAGDVFHTVTSTEALDRREPDGLFDRSLAGRGETFEFRFDVPGKYAFYCRPHSEFMFGTVEVMG